MYSLSDYPGLNRRVHCFTPPSRDLSFGLAKLATPSPHRPGPNANSSMKIAYDKLEHLCAVNFFLQSVPGGMRGAIKYRHNIARFYLSDD